MTSRAGLRTRVRGSLVAGAVLLGHGMLAGAQTAPPNPPKVPEQYVLLAMSMLDVSGPITLTTGSVGVNDTNGELIATPIAPLALNTQDGVIAGNKVRLEQPSTCAALFSNISQGAVRECGTVQNQDIPDPQPPLVTDLDAAAICQRPDPFPDCDSTNDVTVDAGSSTTLKPGVYGDLTVDGGVLVLEGGGEYVFCDVDASDGGEVMVASPSTVFVAGTFTVRLNAQVNAGGTPDDLRIVVGAKGKSAANILGGATPPLIFAGAGSTAAGGAAPRATATCQLAGPTRLRAVLGTAVVARLCAPTKTATLNLLDATVLGTFVADRMEGGDVGGGVTPPSTTTTSPTSSTTTTTSSTSTSTTTSSTTTTAVTSTSTSSTATTTVSTSTAPSTTTTTPSSTSVTSSSTTTTSTAAASTSSTSSSTSTSTSSSVPTPTSTSTSSSTPVATSTSTSSSLPVPSTTSTTVPCDPLRVTEIRVRPSKRDPSKASLSIHGVLADAGWTGANPRRSGVDLGLVATTSPACCTIEQQF
jgi:hypothetical protein